MKVSISAGGREVVVEVGDVNVSPDQIAAQALKLWLATASDATVGEGPGFGLVSSERRVDDDAGFDWRMGEAAPTPVQAMDVRDRLRLMD
jgi:hypothetical protein